MYGTADFLGFQHGRKRFFILGRRKDFDLKSHLATLQLEPVRELLPDFDSPPRRAVARVDPSFKMRMHVLGNAVVPAVSYYAFLKLSGLKPAIPPRPPPREFVLDPAKWSPPPGARRNENLEVRFSRKSRNHF